MDPRRILLAIDDSESSSRAVDYVGRIVGSAPGFTIMVIHVIEEPSEDFYPTEDERRRALEETKADTAALLERAVARLVELGVEASCVSTESPVKPCESLAECILEEHEGREFGTLVVGRRGLSKPEEFLFGSVSNKVIRKSKAGAVWVVE